MTANNISLKNQFLLNPEIIFLNHGSFGATPRPVFDSYQRWQKLLEFQPVKFLGRDATCLLRESREALAKYLGTQADNLVYVTNATTGLNIIARSLALREGDEVLSSDHEYGALDRTWRFLSMKQGFKYINHPIDIPVNHPADFLSMFWEGVTPKTRVIFLSHITSPTAIVFPIEQICRLARERGILTVIDGAHAPGQIPLNLEVTGADYYCGNLHKWLCAPKGSAFMYARPEVQNRLEPLIVSWGWQSDNPGPSQYVDYFEWVGTRDISAFLTVPDAIRFQEENNWDQVRKDCHRLATETIERLARVTGLSSPYPLGSAWYSQMITCRLPDDIDIDEVKIRLYDDYRIEVPLIKWRHLNLIRCSFQAYNSLKDIDALEAALKQILH